jgi:hypothetical protein
LAEKGSRTSITSFNVWLKVLEDEESVISACEQVKQEKLKYVNPMIKEAANAARTAFGTDYEASLRKEAGPAPDKLARRKHQISSLYHQAKMKVLCLCCTS